LGLSADIWPVRHFRAWGDKRALSGNKPTATGALSAIALRVRILRKKVSDK